MPTAISTGSSEHDAHVSIEKLLAQNTRLALQIAGMRKILDKEGYQDGAPIIPFTAINASAADVAQLQYENNQLSAVIERQAQEISVLTRRIETGGDRTREANLRRRLAEVEDYATELEAAHLRTLSSTSWRLTGPFRALLHRLRGQANPEPFRARFLNWD